MDGQKFELESVVVHAGSNSNFGHYYAINRVKVCENGYRWVLCNDSNVTEL